MHELINKSRGVSYLENQKKKYLAQGDVAAAREVERALYFYKTIGKEDLKHD